MPGSPLRDTSVLGRIDGVPVVRLAAVHGLERAVELVTDAIRQAVAQGHPHLLVDTAMLAFAPPSLVARHRIVRRWADAANGRLRLAVVVRPDCIDPEHFGVVAAANFGLTGQVFDREPDALAWLHTEQAAAQRAAASKHGPAPHASGGTAPTHDRQ
jgi:hypothetical protein